MISLCINSTVYKFDGYIYFSPIPQLFTKTRQGEHFVIVLTGDCPFEQRDETHNALCLGHLCITVPLHGHGKVV
jgi:hypothetical protein